MKLAEINYGTAVTTAKRYLAAAEKIASGRRGEAWDEFDAAAIEMVTVILELQSDYPELIRVVLTKCAEAMKDYYPTEETEREKNELET